MGRNRKKQGGNSDYYQSDVNGGMPEESSVFRDFTFDLEASRMQWGLLSMEIIRELELSAEELSAMLESQLHQRDKFIESLIVKLNEIIAKGRELEEDNNYLNHEIWDLQGESGLRKRRRGIGRKIPDGDYDAAVNIKNEGDAYANDGQDKVSETSSLAPLVSESAPFASELAPPASESAPLVSELVAHIKEESATDSKETSAALSKKLCEALRRLKSEAQSVKEDETDIKIKTEKESEPYIKVENETDAKKESESYIKVENKTDVKKESETKTEVKKENETKTDVKRKIGKGMGANAEKDKIKAMVAMAFKAQGYGFLAGMKDTGDSNDMEPGEIKDDEVSVSSEDNNSEQDARGGHGWNMAGGESITQQVVAAASDALAHSGYEYQADLGLYYDHTSGYYYNAENGLYYDPKTGTYFFFDHTTHSYQFHSQVPVGSEVAVGSLSDKGNGSVPMDMDQDEAQERFVKYADDLYVSESYEGRQESQAHIPPSLRLMVIESGADQVKIGALHLVTINGGKVGRGPENLIQLLDVNVSKVHAEFLYRSSSSDDHHYFIKDLGSNLGTFINGTCICIPGEPSDEIEIGHGWELQFGTVKMKCHVHPGYLSCNDCEPGLVLANLPSQSQQSSESSTPVKTTSIEKARLKILKAMKKKYALNAFRAPPLPGEYEDRAEKRRIEKGSDNPYEKTEVASTEVELKTTNKGFEMLQKMGWSKGEGLGKSQPGITAPVEATSTYGREGLGFGQGLPPPPGEYFKRKKILDVTKARFKKS